MSISSWHLTVCSGLRCTAALPQLASPRLAAPLLPLWQQGVLSFVPAAGFPAPNRSHFDAQFQREIAQPGKSSGASGWLNRLARSPNPY